MKKRTVTIAVSMERDGYYRVEVDGPEIRDVRFADGLELILPSADHIDWLLEKED
jgi:hypothetical protein